MSVEDRLREAVSELHRANDALPMPSERQVPRRARPLVLVTFAGAAIAVVVAVAVSLIGGATTQVLVGPPSQSVDQVFAGAEVTTALSWHGRVVAAGSIRPADCAGETGAGCSSGGIPAVWVSSSSGGWTKTWTAGTTQTSNDTMPITGRPTLDGPPIQTLLNAGRSLYLVSSASANRLSPTSAAPNTLELWQSTDALTWHQIRLPAALDTTPVASAVYGHGRLVLVTSSALATTVWSSADGTHWNSSTDGLQTVSPGLGALTVTKTGYLLGMRTRDPQDLPTVWNSRDGVHWSPTTVADTKGWVADLATRGNVTVALVAVNYGYDSFYVTSNGHSWTPAPIPAGMANTDAMRIVTTSSGFLATNRYSMPLLAANRHGKAWTAVQPVGIPEGERFVADTLVEGPNGKVIAFGYTPGPAAFDRPWVARLSKTGNPAASPISTGTLELYVNNQNAKDQLAAAVAGHSQWWQGSTHTDPVRDGNNVIAIVAFSYDPDANSVWVLAYKNGAWTHVASQTDPFCPCAPPHTGSSIDPTHAIQVADVTKDGRPDFLIPLTGAGAVPGAVLSQDGAPGGRWRYISFTGPFPTSRQVGRDPKFQGGTLISTFNSCEPSCAQGTTTTMKWTYRRKTGVFWAPNPPGWTPPQGATNHIG